jgi:hypothetical protein
MLTQDAVAAVGALRMCVRVILLSVHLVQAVKVEDHALSIPVGFSFSCCSCCATVKYELCFLRQTTATAQDTVRQRACTKLLAQTCRSMHARSVTARSLHNCCDVPSKGCAQWCLQQHHCTERMTHAVHTTPHSHKLTCMSSCSGGILHTCDTLVHLLVYH